MSVEKVKYYYYKSIYEPVSILVKVENNNIYVLSQAKGKAWGWTNVGKWDFMPSIYKEVNEEEALILSKEITSVTSEDSEAGNSECI